MAYDAARARLLLFGGDRGTEFFDETWTWQGGLWTKVRTGRHPSARSGAAAIYDPQRRAVVLFGGFAGNKTWLNDTWTWDGSAWTEQHPAVIPPARGQAASAFDPASKAVVVVGGYSSASPGLADAWAWNGLQWRQLPAPPPILWPELVSDGQRLLLLTVGAPEGGRVRGQVWTLTPSGWSRVQPSLSLPFGAVVASFDSQRKAVVALQGDDTWTWQTGTWRRLHPSGTLPFLARRAVYADKPGLVLVRGLLGGLWSWDWQQWSELEAPPADSKADPSAPRLAPVTPAHAEKQLRSGSISEELSRRLKEDSQ